MVKASPIRLSFPRLRGGRPAQAGIQSPADAIRVRMPACPPAVIPAQAGILRCPPPSAFVCRHARPPSFPRKRESYVASAIRVRMPACPPAVIPAQAGILRCLRHPRSYAGMPARRHSRASGNLTLPPPSAFVCRHARPLSFPRKRESYVASAIRVRMPACPPAVIPAQAGILRCLRHPRSYAGMPARCIPAQAGILRCLRHPRSYADMSELRWKDF